MLRVCETSLVLHKVSLSLCSCVCVWECARARVVLLSVCVFKLTYSYVVFKGLDTVSVASWFSRNLVLPWGWACTTKRDSNPVIFEICPGQLPKPLSPTYSHIDTHTHALYTQSHKTSPNCIGPVHIKSNVGAVFSLRFPRSSTQTQTPQYHSITT